MAVPVFFLHGSSFGPNATTITCRPSVEGKKAKYLRYVHRTGDNEAMAMSADAKISEPIIRDYSIVRGLGKCDIRGSGSAGLSLSDY